MRIKIQPDEVGIIGVTPAHRGFPITTKFHFQKMEVSGKKVADGSAVPKKFKRLRIIDEIKFYSRVLTNEQM